MAGLALVQAQPEPAPTQDIGWKCTTMCDWCGSFRQDNTPTQDFTPSGWTAVEIRDGVDKHFDTDKCESEWRLLDDVDPKLAIDRSTFYMRQMEIRLHR